ncbi:MAG: hypothetical protein P9M08_12150 [Candidatus Erginobacter occultus]|nr:hypothetical protein [Candidatus Erginobacter occultus]
MRFNHSFFSYLAAAGLAGGLSLWAAKAIYRSTAMSSDENSYVFQAHCFAEGRISRPYPEPFARAFASYMIILDREHGWLSRYPPGHPLWLAPGIWLGEPRLMVILAAGLSVILLGSAAKQIAISPWAVIVPLLVSPYFISMYGTLLSHTSGFLYVSALLAAYLAWKRTRRPLYAALAGLAWSLLFLNRTFAAGLVALPLGLDALVTGARRWNRRALAGLFLLAVASTAGVFAYFEYNRRAVGDPLTPTYLYYESSEKLGFGPRHTQGKTIYHTPEKGMLEMRDNLLDLDLWLGGFRGSLAVALLLALLAWNPNYTPLLLGSAFSVWLGYVFFWFRGIPEVGGPVYYFESLPMIFLAAGSGLGKLHERLIRRFPRRRLVWPLLAVLAGLNTALVLQGQVRKLSAPQAQRRALLDTLADAPPKSLVFLENIDFPREGEIVYNPRGLESDPLLARGGGGRMANAWLWHQAFRDRSAFLLDGRTPGRLIPLNLEEEPVEIFWDASRTHRQVGANETDGEGRSFRVAYPGSETGFMVFGSYLALIPESRYRASFEVRTDERGAAIRLDVTIDHGRKIIAEQDLELAPGEDRLCILEFVTPPRMVWGEPRVKYLGGGKVMIGRLGLEKLAPVAP